MSSNKNIASSLALFLSLNLIIFALVSACDIDNPTPNPKPKPTPTPTPSTPYYPGKCPRDALKLGVCANVLNLVKVEVGSSPTLPCCSLLQGLVDLEAAFCLCTAIKANILGIHLDVPLSLSLVLNNCGKKLPTGFECT